MNLLNHRTFEKIIAIALTVSVLTSLSEPVFAASNTEVEEDTTSTTTVQFPEIEERIIPKAVRFVSATAYSSDVGQNDATPFLPANGVDYREVFAKTGEVGCVALNDLPLGSVIRITDERVVNTFGNAEDKKKKAMIRVVCDRKNARYNGKWSMDMYSFVAVDGRIDTKASLDEARRIAKQFGVKRQVRIEILEYGTRKTRTRYAYTPANQTPVTLASTSVTAK